MLIADSSTLRYRVAQRSRDIKHKRTSQHARIARRYRLNTQIMQTGDNYLKDQHLKGPYIWPDSDRVAPPPYLPTHHHMRCLICTNAHWTSYLLSRLRWRVDNSSGGESFLGGQASTAVPFPRPQLALRPVGRDVRIVKVLSTSTSCTHTPTVQTCMIKCQPTIAPAISSSNRPTHGALKLHNTIAAQVPVMSDPVIWSCDNIQINPWQENLRNIIHISPWILKILQICVCKWTDLHTAVYKVAWPPPRDK